MFAVSSNASGQNKIINYNSNNFLSTFVFLNFTLFTTF